MERQKSHLQQLFSVFLHNQTDVPGRFYNSTLIYDFAIKPMFREDLPQQFNS
jgi:hypothetical protein